MNIDLLRKDECEPLTQEQMANIKSQFHPSNTANVNITPYHIYDEDEHVVGEWRETISGVKKKKPVYEKKIHFQGSGSNVNIGTISSIEKLIGTYGYIDESSYIWNLNNTGCRVGLRTSDNMLIWQGNVWGSFSACIIPQYTKTSDTWQTV